MTSRYFSSKKTARRVEPGDSGEIVVRGPNIFAGYYDSVDQTDQSLTASGWFWTGDVGVVDDDGYLFIVDRSKDIVIVSGFNVYPAEVEKILMTHPEVSGDRGGRTTRVHR